MSSTLITDATKNGKAQLLHSFVDETGREWVLVSDTIWGLSLVTRCVCECVLTAKVDSLGTRAFAEAGRECSLRKERGSNPNVPVPEEISRACSDIADQRAHESAIRRMHGGGSGLHIPDC